MSDFFYSAPIRHVSSARPWQTISRKEFRFDCSGLNGTDGWVRHWAPLLVEATLGSPQLSELGHCKFCCLRLGPRAKRPLCVCELVCISCSFHNRNDANSVIGARQWPHSARHLRYIHRPKWRWLTCSLLLYLAPFCCVPFDLQPQKLYYIGLGEMCRRCTSVPCQLHQHVCPLSRMRLGRIARHYDDRVTNKSIWRCGLGRATFTCSIATWWLVRWQIPGVQHTRYNLASA